MGIQSNGIEFNSIMKLAQMKWKWKWKWIEIAEIGSADPLFGRRGGAECDVTDGDAADAADAAHLRRHDGVARAIRSVGRRHPRQRRSRDADRPPDARFTSGLTSGLSSGHASGHSGVGTPPGATGGSGTGRILGAFRHAHPPPKSHHRRQHQRQHRRRQRRQRRLHQRRSRRRPQRRRTHRVGATISIRNPPSILLQSSLNHHPLRPGIHSKYANDPYANLTPVTRGLDFYPTD